MKVGIIGSGIVAQQLALGLIKSGHDVKIGTRNPQKLDQWRQQDGAKVSAGSFEDAARFGELLFLSTLWRDGATENAIRLAGKDNFKGKIVIDTTNPLISGGEGQPPTMALGYPDSAGATIQKWLPDARIVKAFNIITAYYMANPKLQEGAPDMFIAGNDESAKKAVTELASGWGWPVIDIGDIGQAYLLEALAMLWIRYGFINGYWKHAFKLLKS